MNKLNISNIIEEKSLDFLSSNNGFPGRILKLRLDGVKMRIKISVLLNKQDKVIPGAVEHHLKAYLEGELGISVNLNVKEL